MDTIAKTADNIDFDKLAVEQTLPKPVALGERYEHDCSSEKGVPKFLANTYNLVSDPSTEHCIAWTREGNSFLITDRDVLISSVLHQFYKHSNFQSFVRQLNMYGFKKVGAPHHWEFFHPGFLRGRPHVLKFIRRRRNVLTGGDEGGGGGGGVDGADDAPGAAGSGPIKPLIVKQIATLKRQRDDLNDDIVALRETQSDMETQLDRILHENAALRTELVAAKREQERMQETVEEIMRLLPVATASAPAGRPSAARAAPAVAIPARAAMDVAPAALPAVFAEPATAARAKRTRNELDDTAADEHERVRAAKRAAPLRVDTAREPPSRAAVSVYAGATLSPEPSPGHFLQAFFRELGGARSVGPGAPMTASATDSAPLHYTAPVLTPLFEAARERTPVSAAFARACPPGLPAQNA